jgi:CHASE3 domain sensor protein
MVIRQSNAFLHKLLGGSKMHKKIILSLIMFLTFVYSGITYAAENPFNGVTQDQIIQKYFEGRQLV